MTAALRHDYLDRRVTLEGVAVGKRVVVPAHDDRRGTLCNRSSLADDGNEVSGFVEVGKVLQAGFAGGSAGGGTTGKTGGNRGKDRLVGSARIAGKGNRKRFLGRAAPDLDPDHFVVQFPLSDAVLMTISSPLSVLRCGMSCLLTVVLSGCTLSKAPSHSQVVDSALPAGTTIPSHWIAGGNSRGVNNNWLKSFHDPRLDAIVAEAIANNLDLHQAAAKVEVARQTVIIVGSRLKPQVGLDLEIASTRDEDHDDWFTSKKGLAGAAWEVDIWGKLRAQRGAAEAGYQATALDYAFGLQSLAATAAKSSYLNIETIELLGIAEETVKVYSDLLDLVKVRRAAGKVSDLDVAEASANFNEARKQPARGSGNVRRDPSQSGSAARALPGRAIKSSRKPPGGAATDPSWSAVVTVGATAGHGCGRAPRAGGISLEGSGQAGAAAQFRLEPRRRQAK